MSLSLCNQFIAFNYLAFLVCFLVFHPLFTTKAIAQPQRLNEVVTFIRKGESKKAVVQLNLVGGEKSSSLPVLFHLAKTEHVLGNHDVSRRIYSKILNLFTANTLKKQKTIEDTIITALSAAFLLDRQGAITLLEQQIDNYSSPSDPTITSPFSSAELARLIACRGTIFLQGHQILDCKHDFKKALELDNNCLPALTGQAMAAFELNHFTEVIEFTDKIFNSFMIKKDQLPIESIEADIKAHYLRGRVYLIESNLSAAVNTSKSICLIAPDNPYSLGIKAASNYAKGDIGNTEKILNHCAFLCKGSELPWFTVAMTAFYSRQNDEAEKYFKKALEADIRSVQSYRTLGELFLRTGREEEAREYFDRALLCDPALINAVNYLNILDYMANQFVFSSTRNTITKSHWHETKLQDRLTKQLAKLIPLYEKKYAFTYKKPIIVELYPDKESFALRSIGLPWLPAIGVSFGRVVALLSPKSEDYSFKIKTVLAHELSHSYTLGITKGRIPRWLTEGLAQVDENELRPFGYAQAFKTIRELKKLTPLSNLDKPFYRPINQLEIPSAYYQSWFVTWWLIVRYGFEKMQKLLQNLGLGKSSPDSIFDFFDNTGNNKSQILTDLYTHADSMNIRPLLLPEFLDYDIPILVKEKIKISELIRQNNLLKAWRKLKPLLKSSPSGDLFAMAGEITSALGKMKRAEIFYSKALKNGDKSIETFIGMAKVFKALSVTHTRASSTEKARLYAQKLKNLETNHFKKRTNATFKNLCSPLISSKTDAPDTSFDKEEKQIIKWEQSTYGTHKRKQLFSFEKGGIKLSLGLLSVLDGETYAVPWLLERNNNTTKESKFIAQALETIALKFFLGKMNLCKQWWKEKNKKMQNNHTLADKRQTLPDKKYPMADQEYILNRLAQKGYPLKGTTKAEETGILILGLEDKEWFVRYRCARLLDKKTGTMKFKNALWPKLQEKEYNLMKATKFEPFQELSSDVSNYWKNWLKKQL